MNIANNIVNIGQAKTDTIGSKYPFVRRNGNMYYHSFPFSFLITAYTDNNHIFATEKQLRDDQKELYAVAYGGRQLSVYNGQYDHVYERDFREKVEAFLYDDKVKLFRSLTEGNMLIKLMNITLTPKQQLGRLLYSVDATAVEIDDATIQRMDYYGIQKIGTYNPNITFSEVFIGQLNRFETQWIKNDNDEYELATVEKSFPAGYDIMGNSEAMIDGISTIRKKYHLNETINEITVNNLYLSYLRIQIDSEPYLIKNVNGTLVPFDDIDPTEDRVDDDTLLGTLIEITPDGNNPEAVTILIQYPNNIYEMKGDNIYISPHWNIKPLKDTKMIVDYTISLAQNKDNTRTATTLIYKLINGQLFGHFNSLQSLRSSIWYKYYLDLYGANTKYVSKPYYIKVNFIYNINVESHPGVVFYAQSNTDTKIRRFVLDQTGELFVDPDVDNGYIKEAYFYGRNIEARRLTNKGTTKPQYPIQLDSYTDSEGTHIYYNRQWYLGTPQENGTSFDIACSVDGIVNYYIQTEKGIYPPLGSSGS